MTSYDSAQTHNRHRPCHPEHHAPLCLAVVSHQLPLYRIVAFTLFTPLVIGKRATQATIYRKHLSEPSGIVEEEIGKLIVPPLTFQNLCL
jgi:hypothetical protein